MEQKVKRITLGLVVSWILGVLFLLSGLTFIFTMSFGVGFPLILASLILLPPINKLIKKKLKFELSRALKIVFVIILFGVYAYNLSNSDKSDSEVEVQPTKEAQEEVAIQPTEEQQDIEPTPQPKEPVKQEPTKKVEEVPKGTYQQCKNEVLQEECKKYGLIYTDYSSAVGFITCTDDGAYKIEDISDSSKYLQVYAPERSIEIKCNKYVKPTGKLGCIEDYLSELCEEENLQYTDYSGAVGFITCTDDGFYTIDEIGNDAKYLQVYLKQEVIEAKCE